MPEIIRFQNITKHFGGTVALEDVTFSVRERDIHAVVGENGAGKSTLMRILSGVLQKDAGTLLLAGAEKTFRTSVDAQREGISTVYQEPYLVPHMTVAENVFLGRERTTRIGFVDFGYLNSQTEQILARLDLKISPTELLINLSPAEVQLVQIARAIAFSTRILILDEPTAAITGHETEILFDLLKKLNKSGLTIIYVSHRLTEIFELCHRATVLRDGKYVGTVEVEKTNEREIISMMVGREIKESGVGAGSQAAADVRLEVKGLTVTRASVRVQDISFVVKRGEIVALAGLVGSGRSEVAKAIFGLSRADAGEVLVEGKPVSIRSPQEAIQYGMALVPEDRKGEGLISTQSIKHNISLTGLKLLSSFGFIRGGSETDLARGSSKQLAIKSSSENAEVSTLSGGNQQKVVLAKWLWLKPTILVLDEPTRGIDVGAKAEIHNLIFELVKTGVAVLLISSELPEVLKLADRIYVMRDGKIVGHLGRAETSQEAIMHLAAIGN